MFKWSGALAALAMMGCATTPDPDPSKEGARLMAQMKAASGGAKLDKLTAYHETGRRVRDGAINGVYEEWLDYRTGAFTTVETFAGVKSAGGYDGKVGWRLGPDGKALTAVNPAQMSSALMDSYVNAQGYFFPDRFPATFVSQGRQQASGKAYDVVTVTAQIAPVPIDLWIDAATHRLARVTASIAPREVMVVIDRYDVIDGVWIVKHAMQTMSVAGETHTEEQIIDAHTFGDVPPERLQVPR